ncbi:MAG TPA: hypothetical protein VF707_01315, partial [Ardenticatenaceae bacterium]
MFDPVLPLFPRRLFLVAALLLLAAVLRPGFTLAQEPDAPAFDARFDLTGNSVVNVSDALDVIGAWTDVHKAGRCIAPELAR